MLIAPSTNSYRRLVPGYEAPINELPAEEAAKIKQLPGSFDAVLDHLEQDHDFLLKGDVFTRDFIETWIDLKRKNDVDAIRLRPHPWEFAPRPGELAARGCRPRLSARRPSTG